MYKNFSYVDTRLYHYPQHQQQRPYSRLLGEACGAGAAALVASSMLSSSLSASGICSCSADTVADTSNEEETLTGSGERISLSARVVMTEEGARGAFEGLALREAQ